MKQDKTIQYIRIYLTTLSIYKFISLVIITSTLSIEWVHGMIRTFLEIQSLSEVTQRIYIFCLRAKQMVHFVNKSWREGGLGGGGRGALKQLGKNESSLFN